MSGRIALVTDSTAYLPDELVRRNGIEVVPVQVVIDGVSRPEGTQVLPYEVAAALRAHRHVSTSRPAPDDFAAAYALAARAGFSGVVSAHLSGELSSTFESAAIAARAADLPVSVVDSRSVAMGLGYAVLAGAEAAARGADLEEVEAAVRRQAARSHAYFYVDTLEFLRRGGRIGAAAAIAGTALSVKPLLQMESGQVTSHSRVRTSGRALASLVDLAVAAAEDPAPRLTVHHLAAEAAATDLAARLRERLPAAEIMIIEVGAVVGAHVGPGLLAVIVA